MSKANAVQVGGTHYKSKAIQPWDYIASNDLGYLEGNIIKYVSRWQDKGGLSDLDKAKHYLEKLIEVETDKAIQKEADRLVGFVEKMAEGRPKKKQKGE
jgi:hypothetical protein